MQSRALNQSTARNPPDQTHPVIWNLTFVLTGIGSTFLGSFLPRLTILWHLRDRQAGMLVAALFLGSFTGTMLLAGIFAVRSTPALGQRFSAFCCLRRASPPRLASVPEPSFSSLPASEWASL